jgi:nitroreductase
MNTLEAISKRKSVRTYTNQMVENDKIKAVINAGNQASRAGQIRFMVITNGKALSAVTQAAKNIMLSSGNKFFESSASTPGFDPIYHAPVMIVISAEKTDDPQTAGINTANAACAAQNMLLAATELGLGSCYVFSPLLAFQSQEVTEMVGLAVSDTPICAVLLGYSDDTAPHAERPVENNVGYCK